MVSQFWRLTSQNKVLAGLSSLCKWKRDPSSSSWPLGVCAFLRWHGVTPVSTVVIMWLSPWVSGFTRPPYDTDSSHSGSGTCPRAGRPYLYWPHLQWPNLQIRLYSEALGVRVSVYPLLQGCEGDAIQLRMMALHTWIFDWLAFLITCLKFWLITDKTECFPIGTLRQE